MKYILLLTSLIAINISCTPYKVQTFNSKKEAAAFLLNKSIYMQETPNEPDIQRNKTYSILFKSVENEFLIIKRKEVKCNGKPRYGCDAVGPINNIILDLSDSIEFKKLGNKRNRYLGTKRNLVLFEYWYDTGSNNWYKTLDNIVNSINTLKTNFDPKEKEEFKLAELKKGKLNNLKTEISEEQRKYIVQANAANEKKEYDNAILLYRKVIELNPYTYPAAYFNMALIHGTMDNYYQAAYAMKQYLIVAPEAEDARQAQDKIYEWELNIKHL